MNPTLEFRLTRSLAPVRGSARFGEHGDLPPPQGDIDPKCGLAFPLRSGGFMLPSAGIIDDASGALEIAFTPLKDRPNGGLVYAWGQYQPLLELAEDAIRLNVYGNSAEVMTPLRAEKECVVRLSWHHESGFTLVVRQRGMRAQTLRRRLAWKAFRQKYVPFCVGGRAH